MHCNLRRIKKTHIDISLDENSTIEDFIKKNKLKDFITPLKNIKLTRLHINDETISRNINHCRLIVDIVSEPNLICHDSLSYCKNCIIYYENKKILKMLKAEIDRLKSEK